MRHLQKGNARSLSLFSLTRLHLKCACCVTRFYIFPYDIDEIVAIRPHMLVIYTQSVQDLVHRVPDDAETFLQVQVQDARSKLATSQIGVAAVPSTRDVDPTVRREFPAFVGEDAHEFDAGLRRYDLHRFLQYSVFLRFVVCNRWWVLDSSGFVFIVISAWEPRHLIAQEWSLCHRGHRDCCASGSTSTSSSPMAESTWYLTMPSGHRSSLFVVTVFLVCLTYMSPSRCLPSSGFSYWDQASTVDIQRRKRDQLTRADIVWILYAVSPEHLRVARMDQWISLTFVIDR